jgi:hypothetical protein
VRTGARSTADERERSPSQFHEHGKHATFRDASTRVSASARGARRLSSRAERSRSWLGGIALVCVVDALTPRVVLAVLVEAVVAAASAHRSARRADSIAAGGAARRGAIRLIDVVMSLRKRSR